MMRIPVTLDFDQTKIVVFMEIDESKLPNTPNYCFSIGYSIPSEAIIDKDTPMEHRLCEVSVIYELKYYEYLKSKYDKEL